MRPRSPRRLLERRRRARARVTIVDEPRSGAHTYVGIDDRAGARLAAEHLTALGHRRIGVVSFRTTDDGYSGPLTPEREAASTYPVTAARLAGWRDGLEASGIPWGEVVKEERVLNARDEGEAGLRELLERDPRITAVLCATDQIALGVMAAAADGRADLSIVGSCAQRGDSRCIALVPLLSTLGPLQALEDTLERT